ncbi:hypothetical protein PHMEG_00025140 [Phytophthora megakarya]|uniref:Uncharacterized protein n=1 Tax=Phytophthora megakarya TaxID=4795 RepID=A0A225VDH1_9STRA|nr:hypothetical protein PHMEG_00025140 [Phytophthora megakarya]
MRMALARECMPSTLEAPAIASDPPAITTGPPVVLSEQRDAQRTGDSVRDPSKPSESVISARYGRTVPPNVIPLYVDSRIVDDAEAASKHFEPMTNQRRDYYISLFHELRYWSSKKTSGRSRVPEWQALCQSWNQYVENFNKDSTACRDRVASARERFMKYSVTSVVQRVHEGLVNASTPCAVRVDIHSPHCPPGAPRISERDLTGYTTNSVPANVKELRAQLAYTRQHPSVVPEHHTPRNTVKPPVHGGLRTRSPFPEQPIVSNEYENEPDLGSSSDWYGLQSDPPRGGSYRGQSYASVGSGGRSSYGQSQVDHGLQSLHARVEALESVQAAPIAVQKAYVAEAAPTTSNIRVEMSEQVRLLQEKVKKLDEKLKSRRALPSASHHG